MPTYKEKITQLLCPKCAEAFVYWTEEERVRRENDDKLWSWAFESTYHDLFNILYYPVLTLYYIQKISYFF